MKREIFECMCTNHALSVDYDEDEGMSYVAVWEQRPYGQTSLRWRIKLAWMYLRGKAEAGDVILDPQGCAELAEILMINANRGLNEHNHWRKG